MAKIPWKPGTMLYPIPAVMVSLGENAEEHNIITIAWTGTICSDPPMCFISVRPNRHSFDILVKNRAFVINLTNEKLAKATDWCGVKSGENVDKFKVMGLTPVQSEVVNAPYILESPVSIECLVTEIKNLGSHHMFIAKVAGVLIDDDYLDETSNSLRLDKAHLISYSHGFYYLLGKQIGRFGFSVMKKKTKKRLRSKKKNK